MHVKLLRKWEFVISLFYLAASTSSDATIDLKPADLLASAHAPDNNNEAVDLSFDLDSSVQAESFCEQLVMQ